MASANDNSLKDSSRPSHGKVIDTARAAIASGRLEPESLVSTFFLSADSLVSSTPIDSTISHLTSQNLARFYATTFPNENALITTTSKASAAMLNVQPVLSQRSSSECSDIFKDTVSSVSVLSEVSADRAGTPCLAMCEKPHGELLEVVSVPGLCRMSNSGWVDLETTTASFDVTHRGTQQTASASRSNQDSRSTKILPDNISRSFPLAVCCEPVGQSSKGSSETKFLEQFALSSSDQAPASTIKKESAEVSFAPLSCSSLDLESLHGQNKLTSEVSERNCPGLDCSDGPVLESNHPRGVFQFQEPQPQPNMNSETAFGTHQKTPRSRFTQFNDGVRRFLFKDSADQSESWDVSSLLSLYKHTSFQTGTTEVSGCTTTEPRSDGKMPAPTSSAIGDRAESLCEASSVVSVFGLPPPSASVQDDFKSLIDIPSSIDMSRSGAPGMVGPYFDMEVVASKHLDGPVPFSIIRYLNPVLLPSQHSAYTTQPDAPTTCMCKNSDSVQGVDARALGVSSQSLLPVLTVSGSSFCIPSSRITFSPRTSSPQFETFAAMQTEHSSGCARSSSPLSMNTDWSSRPRASLVAMNTSVDNCLSGTASINSASTWSSVDQLLRQLELTLSSSDSSSNLTTLLERGLTSLPSGDSASIMASSNVTHEPAVASSADCRLACKDCSLPVSRGGPPASISEFVSRQLPYRNEQNDVRAVKVRDAECIKFSVQGNLGCSSKHAAEAISSSVPLQLDQSTQSGAGSLAQVLSRHSSQKLDIRNTDPVLSDRSSLAMPHKGPVHGLISFAATKVQHWKDVCAYPSYRPGAPDYLSPSGHLTSSQTDAPCSESTDIPENAPKSTSSNQHSHSAHNSLGTSDRSNITPAAVLVDAGVCHVNDRDRLGPRPVTRGWSHPEQSSSSETTLPPTGLMMSHLPTAAELKRPAAKVDWPAVNQQWEKFCHRRTEKGCATVQRIPDASSTLLGQGSIGLCDCWKELAYLRRNAAPDGGETDAVSPSDADQKPAPTPNTGTHERIKDQDSNVLCRINSLARQRTVVPKVSSKPFHLPHSVLPSLASSKDKPKFSGLEQHKPDPQSVLCTRRSLARPSHAAWFISLKSDESDDDDDVPPLCHNLEAARPHTLMTGSSTQAGSAFRSEPTTLQHMFLARSSNFVKRSKERLATIGQSRTEHRPGPFRTDIRPTSPQHQSSQETSKSTGAKLDWPRILRVNKRLLRSNPLTLEKVQREKKKQLRRNRDTMKAYDKTRRLKLRAPPRSKVTAFK